MDSRIRFFSSHIASHAADIPSGIEVGIHNTHILHLAGMINITKQANTVFHCIVEIQTADRVAVAVEGANIFISRIANRCPYTEITAVAVERTICIQHTRIDHNILSQHSIDGIVAMIHLGSQPIKMVGSFNGIIAYVVRSEAQARMVFCRDLHRGLVCTAFGADFVILPPGVFRATIVVRIVAIFHVRAIPEVNLLAICSKHRDSVRVDRLAPDNGTLVAIEQICHLAGGKLCLRLCVSLAACAAGIQVVAVVRNAVFQASHYAAGIRITAHIADIVTVGHSKGSLVRTISLMAAQHTANILIATNIAGVIAVVHKLGSRVRNGIVRITHHTANIRAAADGTGIVAVGCATSAHHTAGLGATADGTAVGVVTVGCAAAAHHTADVASAGSNANVAGVIAVGCVTAAHHTTDRAAVGAGAADVAGVIAVIHTAGIRITHHAADIFAAVAIGTATSDRTGVMAVGHNAVALIDRGNSAHHAAEISIACNGGGVVAIGHNAVGSSDRGNIAHHATNIVFARDIGGHHAYILHLAAFNISEQTNIVCTFVVEIEAANSVVVAVEGAGVFPVCITNRCPDAEIAAGAVEGTIFVQHIRIDHNIIGQYRIEGGAAAIDLGSKPVKMILILKGIVA